MSKFSKLTMVLASFQETYPLTRKVPIWVSTILTVGKERLFKLFTQELHQQTFRSLGQSRARGGQKKRTIKVVKYLPLPTSKAFDQRISPNTRKVVRALLMMIPLIGFGLVILISPLVSTPDKPLSGDEWFSVGYGCVLVLAGVGWLANNLLRDRIPKGLQAYSEEL